jgi:Fe-S cluster biosynthesis and repair protein YggX
LKFESFQKKSTENSIFIKISQEKQVRYMNKNILLIISLSFLLRMKNVSNKKCREKRNTHFVFNNVHPIPQKIMPFKQCGKMMQSGAGHR